MTTHSNVLRGIIEKAVKGGWKIERGTWWIEENYVLFSNIVNQEDIIKKSLNDIIFSHDFAKAFWGTKDVCDECGSEYKDSKFGGYCTSQFCIDYPTSSQAWEYYIQQLALAEDRIKYLSKFL